jgi:hypothetical protein
MEEMEADGGRLVLCFARRGIERFKLLSKLLWRFMCLDSECHADSCSHKQGLQQSVRSKFSRMCSRSHNPYFSRLLTAIQNGRYWMHLQ